MMVIDQAAMRAALHGPVGRQHGVLFDLHCVMTCTSMCGTAEPEIQQPYRAWYLAHYTRGVLEVVITRIECNEGTASHPVWLPDHMPHAARRDLEQLITKALREQDAIDAGYERAHA